MLSAKDIGSSTKRRIKMYKITVPIIDNDMERYGGREKIVRELRRMRAERVFIATGLYFTNPEHRKTVMENLKYNVEYFKERGFEVGVWNWTLALREKTDYTYSTSTDENGVTKASGTHACFLDPDFTEMAEEYLRDFARAGVELIMFDDDYRYLSMKDFACTCDRHMKLFRKEIGEDISPAELRRKALSGGRNKYRDAWMNINGAVMKEFAARMRAAVDEINPNVRVGVCSVMSLWDRDGVDTPTISRILAGRTKPFIRFIGAPYWAVTMAHGRSRLQNCIELHRMERSFTGEDIEVFAEGDSFPRPRHACPASYLELFDMAMRVDGGFDGILKYSIDFYTSTEYERGYIDRQVKNKPIYDAIDKYFSGKVCTGVGIYEKLNKLRDTEIPDELENNTVIFEQFYPEASRMMSYCSIPTVFGDGVCRAVFGENARDIPRDKLKGGVILDIDAAKILTDMGVDVGLREIGNKENYRFEYYPDYEVQPCSTGLDAYVIKVDESAKILSYFVKSNPYIYIRDNETPAAYLYENKEGERFMVFSFSSYYNGEAMSRSYARSRQISDAVEWLSGRKLPAYVYGNPDLYVMAKTDGKEMAIGLFNCFADSAIEPVVELDSEYSAAEFINCTGTLKGDKVILSDIPAFSFAAVAVRK